MFASVVGLYCLEASGHAYLCKRLVHAGVAFFAWHANCELFNFLEHAFSLRQTNLPKFFIAARAGKLIPLLKGRRPVSGEQMHHLMRSL